MSEHEPESTVTLPPQPTINALPEGAAAKRRAASLAVSAERSLQFTQQTMRDEEAQSALAMIRVGRLVGAVLLFALPFFGGSQAMRIAVAGSVVFAIAMGFVIERKIRQPGRYTDMLMVVQGLSVGPAVFTGVLYFGIFSGAQMFPAVAIYFFSRRERLSSAVALFVLNLVTQAVFAFLIIAKQIDDPGLFRADLPAFTLLLGHVLIQVGDLGAFFLGRRSHEAARDALGKMQHAMLLAAQREALLLEARQDLDRALAIDSAGRYTDHTFGAYRLGHVIGRGGMGEVYEANHTQTGDPAAVKLLAPRELANPRSVERFLREVRAVQSVASPHVVRVLASSAEADPIPYLVMERLTGHDLSHHLRSGRIPPEGLDELLAQVGAAVEEAWAQGIVHRDLKPQNLFLSDQPGRPIWKVLDFGVAALSDHKGTLTQGHIVGTPAYMAPEQAKGDRVDHHADVYALSAVAYRWLTGRPATSGRDLHTSLYNVVHVMPQQPSSFADLPADVDLVLALGLAKDPATRWSSVAELRTALAQALRGELDAATRARAETLVAAHPWGAVRT